MKQLLFSLLGVCVLFSPALYSSDKGLDVIYGDDNRVDVYSSRQPSFIDLSRSTAAMIHQNSLKKSSGGLVEVLGNSLKDRGICADERFSHQVTAANCSGFIVAENLLVTAGHCIRSEVDCQNYRWVFDYKVESEDQSRVSVDEENIFSCKKIISRSLDNSTKDDYALIELDRVVSDRTPLNYRQSGSVSRGDELVVIGHPSGLPTKIADQAKVRSLKDIYFVANLDTYGGNSGSAVINVKTLEVEGILVRGETDYVYDYNKGCQVSYRCSNEGCRGEDVTYITNVPELSVHNK
jgi:V8-like Glu-specific endopeptidase